MRAAGQAAPALPEGFKPAAALTEKDLQGYGINPTFIVAVRLADDAQRIVLAEHRPGHDSALHILKPNGAYGGAFDVPSPQLADFSVDPAGSQAFLVGSMGTRFYSADLIARTAKLLMSSLPESPGFRALPPVSVIRSAQGPLVYGLFYESKDVSREVGFARVLDNGTAADLLAVTGWDKLNGPVLSYAPHPLLRSMLIVTQDPGKTADPSKPKPRHLRLAQVSGESRELDVADDIFGTSWSPDLETFAYIRNRGRTRELVLRKPQGEGTVLATGSYFSPVFMNGGKTLVVSTKEPKGNAVWVLGLPDGKPQRLSLPEGPCIYVSDAAGQALAAWGPWGLRVFTLSPG